MSASQSVSQPSLQTPGTCAGDRGCFIRFPLPGSIGCIRYLCLSLAHESCHASLLHRQPAALWWRLADCCTCSLLHSGGGLLLFAAHAASYPPACCRSQSAILVSCCNGACVWKAHLALHASAVSQPCYEQVAVVMALSCKRSYFLQCTAPPAFPVTAAVRHAGDACGGPRPMASA